MTNEKRDDRSVLKATAILFATIILLSSSVDISAQPRNGGDIFSANPSSSGTAPAQTNAAICNDPQIARIEQETGTTARVFDLRASGSKSGHLGGMLQDRGFVEQTGVCLARPNSLVMFIGAGKIAAVDNVTNEYFAASASGGSPAGSNNGGSYGRNPSSNRGGTTGQGISDPELAALRRQDDASLVDTCGTVFEQKGNFNGWPSCLSDRAANYCAGNRRQPACIAIVAKLQDCAASGQRKPIGSSECNGYGTESGSRTVVSKSDPYFEALPMQRPRTPPTPPATGNYRKPPMPVGQIDGPQNFRRPDLPVGQIGTGSGAPQLGYRKPPMPVGQIDGPQNFRRPDLPVGQIATGSGAPQLGYRKPPMPVGQIATGSGAPQLGYRKPPMPVGQIDGAQNFRRPDLPVGQIVTGSGAPQLGYRKPPMPVGQIATGSGATIQVNRNDATSKAPPLK